MKIKNICISIAVIFSCLAYGQDYTAWSDTAFIIVNSGSSLGVTGDVADFPVLVRLDQDIFNFSQAQNNGEDLRFSKEDGTPQPY